MDIKKIIACGMAMVITAGMLSRGTVSKKTQDNFKAYAADTGNDDWLHAVGSRLYDKNGKEVWLTGANWFGFNCTENAPHGLYAADCDKFLSNVADHGINVIRFPISTELLYSWQKGKPNPVNSVQAGYQPPYVDINRDFVLADGKTLKNSMEIFDVIMGKCKTYGLKAIIDVHSPHSDNSGHNYNLWYGKKAADGTMMTTKIWQDTLVWLAKKYKNDDTIIGYDLKNEPHGKGSEGTAAAKWDGSKDENNWACAATNCANAILDANPNALIFIEGVEQQVKSENYKWGQPDSNTDPPYHVGWWGGNLRGVRKYPIKLSSASKNSQIVYSPHDYGPSVYEQTWFQKNFTTQTLLDDYWYDSWAYINAENIAPLLIGEWGGHMDGGRNQKWMELLRDYMIKNHINHTFWCLNPNSGDTGGLLSYDFMTWDTKKYELVKKSLWQTSDGRFIGLDHQTKLGKNGITVTEYYQNGLSSNLSAGSKPAPVYTTPPASSVPTITTTVVTNTSGQIIGDANLDGKLNVRDAAFIAKVLSIGAELPVNADFNGDGVISVRDAASIARYLATGKK